VTDADGRRAVRGAPGAAGDLECPMPGRRRLALEFPVARVCQPRRAEVLAAVPGSCPVPARL